MLNVVCDYIDWLVEQVKSTFLTSEVSNRCDGLYANDLSKENYTILKDKSLILDGLISVNLSKNLLPYSRAIALARLYIRTHSPFLPDSIYFAPSCSLEDKKTDIHIVKRDILNKISEELRNFGIKARRVGIRYENEIIWLPQRAAADLHPLFRHGALLRHTIFGSGTLLFLFILITYTHLTLKYSAAEADLTAIIDTKRQEATSIRKKIQQRQKELEAVEAVLTGKSKTVPVTRIWDELSRILSDDVWISDLTINGNSLTFNGFARESAAGVIATISASELFSEPEFLSSVVRFPGKKGEHFEIRASVRSP